MNTTKRNAYHVTVRCRLTGAAYSRVILLRDANLDTAKRKARTAARYQGYRHDPKFLDIRECRPATPAEIAALSSRLRWVI
jgi:hypothetical protein